MRILKRYVSATVLALALLPATAQKDGMHEKPTATAKGWFVGVQGGMPFGVSTFSSFGADKVRTGYSAGLYGGYRFSPVLSLEATAKWGEASLSAKACCTDHHLWLGADGVRYNAPVLGMGGWGYDDLKSRVFMQHYGVQLNVNVLGFFEATKRGRWTLEVSPLLAAVGTKATVEALSDGAEALRGDARWHLGLGGNLQAACQVTRLLNIGLYSGITCLTGDRMDGMPEHCHEVNYLWESGIKIGFKFGKNRKSRTEVADVMTPPGVETPAPEVAVCPEETTPPVKRETEVTEKPDTVVATPVVTRMELPIVYFAFNQTRLAEAERSKLQEIKKLMEANPEMKITVNGWCDTKGSKAVNDRISRLRAEAVKGWLVRHGIDAARITAKGHGSDFEEPEAAKARRAESVTIKCEEE